MKKNNITTNINFNIVLFSEDEPPICLYDIDKYSELVEILFKNNFFKILLVINIIYNYHIFFLYFPIFILYNNDIMSYCRYFK